MLLLASCSSGPASKPLENATLISQSVRVSAGSTDSAIHERINAHRVSLGLPALHRHPFLDDLARRHSEQMMRSAPEGAGKKISHAGFLKRSFQAEAQLRINQLSENVAYTSSGSGEPSKQLLQGWLDSKGHRRNLTTAKWRLTGIGVAKDHHGRIWATQVFGTTPGSQPLRVDSPLPGPWSQMGF